MDAEIKNETPNLPPSNVDIDNSIAGYEYAKAAAKQATLLADAAKQRVIFLVDNFGYCPANAPQSKRLDGLRNTATVTRGSSVTVKEGAVQILAIAIANIPGLFKRLFTPTTKHSLVKGAADAIKALDLPERRLEKILSLFGQCFDVKTAEPSLSVSVIKAEKPAKKPRPAKAAA